MLIDSLTFSDFLVFKGCQSLDFGWKKDRNITIVLAPNNTGKTSVIRGLKFLLYGTKAAENAKTYPCLRTVAGMKKGDTGYSYVEATIRHGDSKYVVRRTITFARVDEDSVGVQEIGTDLEVTLKGEMTDRTLPAGVTTDTLVGNLVPEAMFDFYFFKGEELAEQLLRPKAGTRVPEQLQKVLYQKEWQSLATTLDKCERRFRSKMGATTQEQHRIQTLLVEKDSTKAKEGALIDQLDKEKRSLEQEKKNWEAADQLMTDLASRANPNRRKEIEKIDVQLKKVRSRQDEHRTSKNTKLAKLSSPILLTSCLDEVADVLSVLKQKRALPPDISEGILGKILDDKECICGHEVCEGQPSYGRITELRRDSLREDVADDLWRLHTFVAKGSAGFGIREQVVRGVEDLRKLDQGIKEGAIEIAELSSNKEELQNAIDENAEKELKVQKLRRAKAGEQTDMLKGNLRRREQQLVSIKDQLQKIEYNLNQSKAQDSRSGRYQAAIALSAEFREAVGGCQKALTRKIRDKLAFDIKMYDRIVTDGSIARLDTGSLLPVIERSGVRSTHTGGGQEQVLLLCYLVSLARLRKEINESLGKRFKISSFQEQGFFMDSVFGQTQADYKKSIVKLLPENMPQLVLLLSDQQWGSEIEEGITGMVTNVYGFKLHTPRQDIEEDSYRYQIKGKEWNLLTKLEVEGEEAYTEIVTIMRLKGK